MWNMRFSHILAILFASVSLQAHLTWENTDQQVESGLTQETAEIQFTFTNENDEPVQIIDLKSSCGCTVPELEKRVYAPGESGTIKALFTFGAREGRQHKRVTVTTDMDGRRQIDRLSFTTEIPSWATLNPRLLRWQRGVDPAPAEAKLVINDPDRIHPPELVADSKAFTVELSPEENGTWVFTVTPVSTEEMATEKIAFTLEASEDGRTRTREFSIYGLIR